MKKLFILYIFFILLFPNIVNAAVEPDFGENISMDRSSTIVLTDRNSVISNYRVNGSFIVNAIIEGNNLTLMSDMFSGVGVVEFRNNIDSSLFILRVQINVEKIKIIQVDSVTKSKIPQLGQSFLNTKYNILDSNNNIVDSLIIDNNSEAISKSLQAGNYCLRQTSAINNYEITNEDYCFTITGENTIQEITLENKYISPVILDDNVDIDNNNVLIETELLNNNDIENVIDNPLPIVDNPKTIDNIYIYFSLSIVSLISIILIKKRLFN